MEDPGRPLLRAADGATISWVVSLAGKLGEMRPGARIVLTIAVLSFVTGGCSMFGGKAAEEPAYRIVLDDGAVQIREYGSYGVVETVVEQPFEAATREGFRRLFDYISGANRGTSRIEMTAPVVAAPESVAMTAPALASPSPTNGSHGDLEDRAGAGWTIAFVLPEDLTAATAPEPVDERVALRDVPAQRVAVIRFAGLFRNAPAEALRRDLAAWLEARSLAHEGDWRMAGYNPPWTLPPLRRNEVIVTLSGNE